MHPTFAEKVALIRSPFRGLPKYYTDRPQYSNMSIFKGHSRVASYQPAIPPSRSCGQTDVNTARPTPPPL